MFQQKAVLQNEKKYISSVVESHKFQCRSSVCHILQKKNRGLLGITLSLLNFELKVCL